MRRLVTDAELDALASTLSATVYGMGAGPAAVKREQERCRRRKVAALVRIAEKIEQRRRERKRA